MAEKPISESLLRFPWLASIHRPARKATSDQLHGLVEVMTEELHWLAALAWEVAP